MITLPVGTVIKHDSGAIAIITNKKDDRVWGIYSQECKFVIDKFHVGGEFYTELAPEGWSEVSKFKELTKEQIAAYWACLKFVSTKIVIKLLEE